MRRRSKGEGLVYHWPEKNLWVGKLALPDGKRKTKYGHTQKEVKDWLLAERNNISQGNYIPDERMTLAGFLARYLADYGEHSHRATTYHSYEATIQLHIVPELGALRLTQLRADHLNHLYTKSFHQASRIGQLNTSMASSAGP